MRNIALLLLIAGIAYSQPSCDPHQYHDFVWESAYSYPPRPPDTLIDQCGSTGVDPAICSQMANPNLTIAQKRQLVLDGLLNTSAFPDFDTVKGWNQNLTFTKYAPDGVSVRSSTNIRDAWNKIIAVYPSIYAKNRALLVNGSGQVDSRHGFSFVVRHETFPSDCSTQYEICGYDYQVSDNFGLPVTSRLTINTQYLIHHYHLVTHCHGHYCYTTCDYSSSDNRRDSMTINDQLPVSPSNSQYFAYSFVESMNSGLAEGWLVFLSTKESNFGKFTWENSTIKFKESAYKLVSNFTPYNVIAPDANQSPNDFEFYGLTILSRENHSLNGQELSAYLAENESVILSKLSERGISLQPAEAYRYEKIHFLAPVRSLDCRFDFYDYFSHENESGVCYFDNQTPIINLTLSNRTNTTIAIALRFYDNQTNAPYAVAKIRLWHGNQSLFVLTDANGNAQASFDYAPNSPIVFAEFKTDLRIKSAKAQLAIPTEFPFTLADLFYLAALLLVFYLLYKLAKRWIK